MKSPTRTPHNKGMSRAESADSQVREEQILAAAAKLFKERGFAGTTLLDVAQAIGVSRTAVYHYFSSKEQMFYSLAERTIQAMPEIFESAVSSGLPPEETMREILRTYVRGMTSDGPCWWLILTEAEHHLSPQQFRRLHRMVRQNDATLLKVFSDGVRSGRFSAVHPKMAVFMIAGACNWLSRWYDPSGEIDVETVVDTFLQIVEHGVVVMNAVGGDTKDA